MSRLIASSRMARVDGTEGGPLGTPQEGLQLGLEVEILGGRHQVVDEPNGQLPGSQTHPLVLVAVDHVVAPRLTLDAARLSAAQVMAGLLLQLQGDVLGDVTQPGAFAQALDEATLDPARAAVILQRGEELEEPIGESVDRVGRIVLQHTEIHDQVDRRLIGPDVAAAIHAGLHDPQVGRDRARRGGPFGGCHCRPVLWGWVV